MKPVAKVTKLDGAATKDDPVSSRRSSIAAKYRFTGSQDAERRFQTLIQLLAEQLERKK